MAKTQRHMALRVICTYRTVSLEAALILSEIPPIKLTVIESANLFKKVQPRDTAENSKANLLIAWQHRWDHATDDRWTYALIENVRKWVKRSYSDITSHITQTIRPLLFFFLPSQVRESRFSGMCFLQIRKCNAEHTLFYYDAWHVARRSVRILVGLDLDSSNMVDLIIQSKNNCNAISSFIKSVLKNNEQEERAWQVTARNA